MFKKISYVSLFVISFSVVNYNFTQPAFAFFESGDMDDVLKSPQQLDAESQKAQDDKLLARKSAKIKELEAKLKHHQSESNNNEVNNVSKQSNDNVSKDVKQSENKIKDGFLGFFGGKKHKKQKYVPSQKDIENQQKDDEIVKLYQQQKAQQGSYSQPALPKEVYREGSSQLHGDVIHYPATYIPVNDEKMSDKDIKDTLEENRKQNLSSENTASSNVKVQPHSKFLQNSRGAKKLLNKVNNRRLLKQTNSSRVNKTANVRNVLSPRVASEVPVTKNTADNIPDVYNSPFDEGMNEAHQNDEKKLDELGKENFQQNDVNNSKQIDNSSRDEGKLNKEWQKKERKRLKRLEKQKAKEKAKELKLHPIPYNFSDILPNTTVGYEIANEMSGFLANSLPPNKTYVWVHPSDPKGFDFTSYLQDSLRQKGFAVAGDAPYPVDGAVDISYSIHRFVSDKGDLAYNVVLSAKDHDEFSREYIVDRATDRIMDKSVVSHRSES